VVDLLQGEIWWANLSEPAGLAQVLSGIDVILDR
jgi:hypothetical protein